MEYFGAFRQVRSIFLALASAVAFGQAVKVEPGANPAPQRSVVSLAGENHDTRKLDLSTGKSIYLAACVACHGPDGKGQPDTTLEFTFLHPKRFDERPQDLELADVDRTPDGWLVTVVNDVGDSRTVMLDNSFSLVPNR